MLTPSDSFSGTNISGLSPTVWDQGYRACSALGIRTEVFMLDAKTDDDDEKAKELLPLRVSEVSFKMELLQLGNLDDKSVFIVKENENIEYIYERSLNDPRIVQKFNIQLDRYGNPIEGVVIAYPRQTPDLSLPATVQLSQSKFSINYIRNSFTNDIDTPDVYRLRMPVDSSSYEVRNIIPVGDYFELSEFTTLFTDAIQLKYHEDTPPTLGASKGLRQVSQKRNIYYDTNVRDKLPLGVLGNLGMVFESYVLCYDKTLTTDIYGTKISDVDLLTYRFVHLDDDKWWIPSGRSIYSQGADTLNVVRSRFFMPISFTSANLGQ